MPNKSRPFARFALGGLLGVVAVNAFAGGYYAIAGAEGVATEWLAGSPFISYFLPGLILFIVVGGAFTVAAIAVFARWTFAKPSVFTAVVIVLIWLAVQVAVTGYVSWMQPATATVALAILVMTLLLPESDTVSAKEKQRSKHH